MTSPDDGTTCNVSLTVAAARRSGWWAALRAGDPEERQWIKLKTIQQRRVLRQNSNAA